MPLIKPVLERQIYAAFKKLLASSDQASAQRDLASDLASAIDSYIKSATIITPPGQVVTGAAATGGPVTAATTTPSAPAQIV